MTIRVTSDAGIEKDHHVAQDKLILVHTNDYVIAGDPLTQGPLVPHDILRIKGEDALCEYMLDEVQNVYRAQGVPINDKHVEVILRQMLSKVFIESPGDTEFLPNEVVDKFEFRQANQRIAGYGKISEPGDTSLPLGSLVSKSEIREANAQAEVEGQRPAKAKKTKPATAKTLLLGITKASLQSRSWLSGASIQETTKVLTEAALRGAVDDLNGLKENVLLGHLIPAGTGFRKHQALNLETIAPPVMEIDEDELEAEIDRVLAEAGESMDGMNENGSPDGPDDAAMASADADEQPEDSTTIGVSSTGNPSGQGNGSFEETSSSLGS